MFSTAYLFFVFFLVIEPKFVCLMLSEVKQTEILKFGVEKWKEWLMLKRPELPNSFQGTVFIGEIWGEVCRVCDLPLVCWWWGNQVVFQVSQLSASGSNWFCSPWLGALVSVEELRDYVSDCSVYLLAGSQDQDSSLHYCFSLHFFTSLISDCVNLPFGTPERSKRQKPFSIKTRNGGHGRTFVPGMAP